MRCLGSSLGFEGLRPRQQRPLNIAQSCRDAGIWAIVLLCSTNCGVFEGGRAEADRAGPEPASSAIMGMRAQVYSPPKVEPEPEPETPAAAKVEVQAERIAQPERSGKPSSTAPGADWSWFNSKPGRFHAEFPTQPQPGQRQVGTPVGELTNWEFRARHGRTEYVVNYTDIPKLLAATVPSRRVLKGSRDRTVEKLGGRLVSDRDISKGRVRGREFEIDVREQGVPKRITMRNYLVGNRLYHLVHRRPAEHTTTEDLQRFFSSFSFRRD